MTDVSLNQGVAKPDKWAELFALQPMLRNCSLWSRNRCASVAMRCTTDVPAQSSRGGKNRKQVITMPSDPNHKSYYILTRSKISDPEVSSPCTGDPPAQPSGTTCRVRIRILYGYAYIRLYIRCCVRIFRQYTRSVHGCRDSGGSF